MIVIIVESMHDEVGFRQQLEKYQQTNDMLTLLELNGEEANRLLVLSSPPAVETKPIVPYTDDEDELDLEKMSPSKGINIFFQRQLSYFFFYFVSLDFAQT